MLSIWEEEIEDRERRREFKIKAEREGIGRKVSRIGESEESYERMRRLLEDFPKLKTGGLLPNPDTKSDTKDTLLDPLE